MPRIIEIERESISPPWSIEALLGEIRRDDSFFALAAENATVFGFVILRNMADEGELLQIAVGKAHRRRGIADLLMKAALFHSEESSQSAIYLEVRESGEAAINLYKKHGFRQIGSRKNYYSQPIENAIMMARPKYQCTYL